MDPGAQLTSRSVYSWPSIGDARQRHMAGRRDAMSREFDKIQTSEADPWARLCSLRTSLSRPPSYLVGNDFERPSTAVMAAVSRGAHYNRDFRWPSSTAFA